MNAGGKVVASEGCTIKDPANPAMMAAAVAAAKSADVVVIMAGIDQSQEAEGRDRINTTLPGAQPELIRQILELRKPTVLVLIHGGTISLGPLKSASPVIVDAFYGGEMASAALASVLFGETNPSGRMAATAYPPEYVDQIPLTEMAMTVPPGRTHLYYTETPEFKFGDGMG
jgi:beta-D-xylosidase 4